jgi:hypothetical protein
MQIDSDVLMARIERLERRSLRVWWLLASLAAAALCLRDAVGIAAPRSTVVEANEFVLRDSTGAKRGELVIGPDGGGRIVLYGLDGQVITELPMTTRQFPVEH